MPSAADLSAWTGFLGTWLLVAGPMFQGALELHAEDVDREGLHRISKSVPMPPRISPWWWLLPPVLYLLYQRRRVHYRTAMYAAMTPEQREKTMAFLNKATGWFMVSAGGALLAGKETWTLVQRYTLPTAAFWLVVVVMLVACTLNTTVRILRAERLVNRASKG